MTKDLDPKKQLSFEDASNLTIEEAVRKEADLKAGVTDKDGALDKYIKHHQDEVSNKKFANLDTGSLDKFIKNQRQKLEEEGMLPPLAEGATDKAKDLGMAGAAVLGAGLAAGGAKLAQAGSGVADKAKDLAHGATEKAQGIKSDLTNLDGLKQVKDLKPADSQFMTDFEETITGKASAAQEKVAAASSDLLSAGQQKAGQLSDVVKDVTAKPAGALAAGAATATAAAAGLAVSAKDKLKAGDQAAVGANKSAQGTATATKPVTATGPVAGVGAAGSGTSSKAILASETLLDNPSILAAKPGPKNKKLVIGALAAILLGTVGLGYGLNRLNQSANSSVASSSADQSSSSKAATGTSAEASKDLKAFNDLYANFFVDKEASKPKNSEFGNLSKLEEALKKLEGTTDYDAAKSKYDSLNKMVTAIKAINSKFETDAIVDGEKVEATLKEGATFDDLSSDVLNTGKASMDTLIQAVLAEGRGLVTAGGGRLTSGNASASGAATGSAPAATATGAGSDQAEAAEAPVEAAPAEAAVSAEPAPAPVIAAEPVSEPIYAAEAVVPAVPAPATTPIVAEGAALPPALTLDPASLPAGHVAAPTVYGHVSYNPTALERHLSRVPFNFDLVADGANAAWTFTPGVMEEIIRVSQQRGYITGHDFILEPVNIINGNGYYNMYRPDGTYLFSINAKTGYFFGNGSGGSQSHPADY